MRGYPWNGQRPAQRLAVKIAHIGQRPVGLLQRLGEPFQDSLDRTQEPMVTACLRFAADSNALSWYRLRC